MIKLKLDESQAEFSSVTNLPGLKDISLDSRFGLIAISPTDSLYVVRSEFIDNISDRKVLSPEIIEAYGDVRISTS